MSHARDRARHSAESGSPCRHRHGCVRNVTRIERRIELKGSLAEEQRQRLLEIADRCPIKRNLEAGLEVVSAQEDTP